eukprot:14847813-Ditylum_brightwellii.AAC.1
MLRSDTRAHSVAIALPSSTIASRSVTTKPLIISIDRFSGLFDIQWSFACSRDHGFFLACDLG